MSEIVFLLEEPSAEAMLEGLLPKILPDNISYRCIVFEGKQDLEKQLVRRIRGYRLKNARFVILRDQDAGDCYIIKTSLLAQCSVANTDVLVRIACRELESWYLADLSAVEMGLQYKNISKLQNKNPYRSPDTAPSPSHLLLQIAPKYQKVSGSRAIGPYLDPENKRSRSFAVFVNGVRSIIRQM